MNARFNPHLASKLAYGWERSSVIPLSHEGSRLWRSNTYLPEESHSAHCAREEWKHRLSPRDEVGIQHLILPQASSKKPWESIELESKQHKVHALLGFYQRDFILKTETHFPLRNTMGKGREDRSYLNCSLWVDGYSCCVVVRNKRKSIIPNTTEHSSAAYIQPT